MPLKKSLRVEYNSDFAVNCEDNHHSSLILNDKLHSIVRNFANGNDTLKTYNLLHHKVKDINLTNKDLFCADTSYKTFSFCNKHSLLIGKLDYKTWKLRLYQLDYTKAACATWEQVAYFKYSISDSLFDLQNCIPVSHGEDKVILVSVLNNDIEKSHCIVFHIFSQKAKNWKIVSALLPIQFTRTAEYHIQSCIVVSNYIYCSLLLHGTGTYIYKFDLILFQQRNINIRPVCSWEIREPTLQSCFLSILQEEVVASSFKSINNKSIMEVRRLINFSPSLPVDYQFEYQCEVKIIAASVISTSRIIVVHYDNKTKMSFITVFTI